MSAYIVNLFRSRFPLFPSVTNSEQTDVYIHRSTHHTDIHKNCLKHETSNMIENTFNLTVTHKGRKHPTCNKITSCNGSTENFSIMLCPTSMYVSSRLDFFFTVISWQQWNYTSTLNEWKHAQREYKNRTKVQVWKVFLKKWCDFHNRFSFHFWFRFAASSQGQSVNTVRIFLYTLWIMLLFFHSAFLKYKQEE